MVFNNDEDYEGNMSLDGRSLIVPDYGDVDDMSSLGANSKFTYRGDGGVVGYIGDKKIVAKKSPSKMTSLEKKLASYQGDPEIQDYGVEIFDRSIAAERKDTDLSQSFEEKKNEEEKGKKSRCIPRWITEAPLWLKLIIIVSIALLVGAAVLIVVGSQLSKEDVVSASTKDDNPASESFPPESGTYSSTFSPTVVTTISPEKPALVTTTSPSASPLDSNVTVPTMEETPILETKVPTDAPSSKLSTADTLNSKDILSTSSPSAPGTTDYPTYSPTTSAPTSNPTNSPTTANPSSAPSGAPTTAYPSSAPTTAEPTSAPTTLSPTVPPTQNPTFSPTVPPTKAPTQSPTISMINFFVMGGRFDDEERRTLTIGLESLPLFDENTILVHLGDWNSPYTTSCLEESFLTNVDSYRQSSVPVYFVPGDNEYNDCPDPTQALGLWNQYFLNFETKYWEEPSWEVTRQLPSYGENFAFLQREVLFIGINLVGGIVHDQNEWDSRHQANLLWIDTTAAKYNGSYTTIVILAHADPDIEINQNFFVDFYPMVERYDEQVIFLHRNLGVDTWNAESKYNGISNLDVVSVEGSKWPPMWVQIDPQSGSYNIDQSDWYDQYISKGKLPRSP